MAEFTYSTSKTIYAPFLVDSEQLDKLDQILDEEWTRLLERNKSLLKKQVEKEIKEDYIIERYEEIEDEKIRTTKIQTRKEEIESREKSFSFKDERSLTIYLKGDRKVVVNSFREAIREPNLLEERPVGFEAKLQSGDIRGHIEIRQSGDLYLSVSPEHLTESRELFVSLLNWTETVRPPKWQQYWKILNPIHWGLWIAILWFGSLFLVGSESAARTVYREQARQLLQEGISQEEQAKAIEIILALNSGYIPQNQNIPTPGWFVMLLIGGFLVCILLTIEPKSRIGIGRGRNSVKYWRHWIQFISIIFPSFVFVNIIFPYFSKLFSNLF